MHSSSKEGIGNSQTKYLCRNRHMRRCSQSIWAEKGKLPARAGRKATGLQTEVAGCQQWNQLLDVEEVTVAEPFAKRFGVTGFFNHTCKRVFVVPFALLSPIMRITINDESQALWASSRRYPWGWQDAV